LPRAERSDGTEPGAREGGHGSDEEVVRAWLRSRGIQRVRLDDARAARAGVRDGRVEEPGHDALMAVIARDDEAGHGPHRIVVGGDPAGVDEPARVREAL